MIPRTTQWRMGDRGIFVWRLLALGGLVVTLVATHWPRLRLSSEAPSDKVLHAVTYGVLTLLVWRTTWFARWWHLVAAMVVFASIDEWTQSLRPFLRHTSWNDWIADLVGIAVCTFLLACSVSARGESGELRRALQRAAERRLFDRPFTWLAMATSAVLGAFAGGAITMTLARLLLEDTKPFQTLFLGAIFFAAAGVDWTLRAGLRAMTKQITEAHACLHCGHSIGAPGAAGQCTACGAPWLRAQWVAPPELWSRDRQRLRRFLLLHAVRAAAVAFVAIGTIGVIAWAALMLWDVWFGERLAFAADMRDLFAYAYALAWIALTIRLVRSAVARVQACEGQECLACGYTLHGVHAVDGVGRCTECGTEFVAHVRIPHPTASPSTA